MHQQPQERVLRGLPPAAHYGLQPLPAEGRLGAEELTTPTQLGELLTAHRQLYPGAYPAVVATLWWYLTSASWSVRRRPAPWSACRCPLRWTTSR